MKPFRERNPVTIGLVGFASIGLIMVGAFKADQLPLIGGGDTYHADFSEAGSLRAGNEVRVAGVRVGKVKKVDLQGAHVQVTFQISKGTDFGTTTGAEIRVKTLLGAEFLALTPAGPGQLPKGSTIPLSRTVAPYDVVQAFSQLSETTDQINIPEVSKALDTLAGIAHDTPEEFRGAIKGVSDLSSNLAARDDQLNTLLGSLKKVTGVINSRDSQLQTLFEDSNTLFQAVSARRESIHELLVSTTNISDQLRGLVKDTKADLHPALTQLGTVTAMLRKNEASLDEALRIMGPFDRVFANALGTGPWFDSYIAGIPPNLGVADQLKKALGLS